MADCDKFLNNMKWLKAHIDPTDIGYLHTYPKWIIEDLEIENADKIVEFLKEKYNVQDIITFELMLLDYPYERFKQVWEEIIRLYGEDLFYQISCDMGSELYGESLTDIFIDVDLNHSPKCEIEGPLGLVRHICKIIPAIELQEILKVFKKS